MSGIPSAKTLYLDTIMNITVNETTLHLAVRFGHQALVLGDPEALLGNEAVVRLLLEKGPMSRPRTKVGRRRYT
jgi:hypothetical protein